MESNYQDPLIIEHLRKPVRLALVVHRLAPLFEKHQQKLP